MLPGHLSDWQYRYARARAPSGYMYMPRACLPGQLWEEISIAVVLFLRFRAAVRGLKTAFGRMLQAALIQELVYVPTPCRFSSLLPPCFFPSFNVRR